MKETSKAIIEAIITLLFDAADAENKNFICQTAIIFLNYFKALIYCEGEVGL